MWVLLLNKLSSLLSGVQLKIIVIFIIIGLSIGSICLFRLSVIRGEQYRESQRELTQIKEQIKIANKVILQVEKAKDDEQNKANKALLEISDKGHISTLDGNNPEWMRSESKPCCAISATSHSN